MKNLRLLFPFFMGMIMVPMMLLSQERPVSLNGPANLQKIVTSIDEVLLYQQTSHPSTESTVAVQDFPEPEYDAFDSEAADDFTVPSGMMWSITQIMITGMYYPAGTFTPVLHMAVYTHDMMLNKPGTELVYFSDVPYTPMPGGSFTLNLPEPVVLTEGQYWLSVQPLLSGNLSQWFWSKQDSPTINQEFVWRNPGDGFGTGLTNWTYGSLVPWGSVMYDWNLSFEIYGTACPNVQLFCPPDMIIPMDQPPFELSGAIPDGGTYSGTGVMDNWFNPVVAGPGVHLITYLFTNECGYSWICTFNITVENVQCPTVNAGPDQTIYAGESCILSEASATNYSSVYWTTSGDGSFNNSSLVNPAYSPGIQDIALDQVDLCLVGTPIPPCTQMVDDCMTLTILPSVMELPDAALVTMGTCIDQDFFILTQYYGMTTDLLDFSANYDITGNWTATLSGLYNGYDLSVTYVCTGIQLPDGSILSDWSSNGQYGTDLWTGSGNALYTAGSAVGEFLSDYESSVVIGSNSGGSDLLISGIDNPSEILYTGATGTVTVGPLVYALINPSLHYDKHGKVLINDVEILGKEIIKSTIEINLSAAIGNIHWLEDLISPEIALSQITFTGTYEQITVSGLPGAVTDDRIELFNYVTVQLKDQDNNNIGELFANQDGSFALSAPLPAGTTAVYLYAVDDGGNQTSIMLPWPVPQYPVIDPEYIAIVTMGTCVDQDFLILTQTYAMTEEFLEYHASYDESGNWTGNLSGVYNGLPLEVTYNGSCILDPDGSLFCTWNSSGYYGADPWISSGNTLYTGSGENFQSDYQSTIQIGTNTGSSSFLIDGIQNATNIMFTGSMGTVAVNASILSSIGPSITVDIPNRTVTNDVEVWFVEVVVSSWTFDEIQNMVDGALQWLKDLIAPYISVANINLTGDISEVTVTGTPGAVFDELISLPNYVTMTLTDQNNLVLGTTFANTDGSFGITATLPPGVTSLILSAMDGGDNVTSLVMEWPPVQPVIDPEYIAILTMGTCLDQDFLILTQTYAMTEEFLEYHASYDESGNWTGNLSGVYNGLPLEVTYNGSCILDPDGSLFCTWNSSGYYGADPWISSGNTLYTGSGENFQSDYQSTIQIGTNTGSSSFLIDGIQNATNIMFTGSIGTVAINASILSSIGPSITVDIPNRTVTNDVEVWFVEVVVSSWTFDEIQNFVDGALQWLKDLIAPYISVANINLTGDISEVTVTGTLGAVFDELISLPNYVTMTLTDQNNLVLGTTYASPDGSFAITAALPPGVTSLILSATDGGDNIVTEVFEWTAQYTTIWGTATSETGMPIPPDQLYISAISPCFPYDRVESGNGITYTLYNDNWYYMIDYSQFQTVPQPGDQVWIHFLNTVTLEFNEIVVFIPDNYFPYNYDVELFNTLDVVLPEMTAFIPVVIPPHTTLKVHYLDVVGCGNTDVFQLGSNGWYKFLDWNHNPYCTWRYIQNDSDDPEYKIIHNNNGYIGMEMALDFTAYPTSPGNEFEYASVNLGWNDGESCKFGNIVSPSYTFNYEQGVQLQDFPATLGAEGVVELTIQFESYENIYWLEMSLFMDISDVMGEGYLYVDIPEKNGPKPAFYISAPQNQVSLNLGAFPGPAVNAIVLTVDPTLQFSTVCFSLVSVYNPNVDYGDLPAPYPTRLINNGARHINDGTTYLGANIDVEPDGWPDPKALGDDNNNVADEDGVIFPGPFVVGGTQEIKVIANSNGFLNAWMDFNRDGSLANAGDQIFTDQPLTPGLNVLNITIPLTANVGNTFARFRFNTTGGLSFTGLANDGEVEDYQISLLPSSWSYAYTPSTHLISVPLTVNLLGFTLAANDAIGVFYANPNPGQSCGGAAIWDGVNNQLVIAYGDDPTTTPKDGFAGAEDLIWKVYLNSLNLELTIVPTYDPAFPNSDGKFTANGLSGLSGLTYQQCQTLQIPKNWSGISTRIIPFNPDVTVMFAPVNNDLVILYSGVAVYWPAQGVNSIGNWDISKGYIIKMLNNRQLQVCGTIVNPKTITFNVGWNLIPVYTQVPAASFLGGLPGFVVAKGIGTPEILWPAVGINTLITLKTGKAYWVYTTSAGSLTYPDTDEESSGDKPLTMNLQTPWNSLIVSPVTHLTVFTASQPAQFEAGDYIGAFTNSGLCAGAIEMSQNGLLGALIINADDPTTAEAEGFAEGEQVQFRLWRHLIGETVSLEVTSDPLYDNAGIFTSNGLSVVKQVSIPETGVSGYNNSGIRLI